MGTEMEAYQRETDEFIAAIEAEDRDEAERRAAGRGRPLGVAAVGTTGGAGVLRGVGEPPKGAPAAPILGVQLLLERERS